MHHCQFVCSFEPYVLHTFNCNVEIHATVTVMAKSIMLLKTIQGHSTTVHHEKEKQLKLYCQTISKRATKYENKIICYTKYFVLFTRKSRVLSRCIPIKSFQGIFFVVQGLPNWSLHARAKSTTRFANNKIYVNI